MSDRDQSACRRLAPVLQTTGTSRRSSCVLASLDLRRHGPNIGSGWSAESAASGGDRVFRSGAPQPTRPV